LVLSIGGILSVHVYCISSDRALRQLTFTTDGLPDTTVIDYDELGRIKKQKFKGSSGDYQITTYTCGTVYGVLESTGNILKGEGSVWDALNFIPALQLASAFKRPRKVSSAIVEADAAVTQVAKKTECFVAGTEIQTLDGTRNIEDIQVGDWVLSDDPNTVGEIEYKQVLNTFVKETSNLVDIYIDGEKITTTEEHPFWVPDVGWVAAKDLVAGSLLQTKYESWLDVDKVVKHSDTATVYNFEVEGFHTYFVSDLGLLVHNYCGEVLQQKKVDTSVNAGSSFDFSGTGSPPKWGNIKSEKAYGHSVPTHGAKVKAIDSQNRANAKGKNGQWYDDKDIIEAEKIAPQNPGIYVIDFGRSIGRVRVKGEDPIENVTRFFIERNQNGTIKTSFPVDDLYEL
jgi:Pretoxin HINT domain